MTRVAVTLGDPRGIGPEIVAQVIESPPVDRATFVVIGPDDLVASLDTETIGIGRAGTAPDQATAGALAGAAIERAAALALAGDVDAIVTAPIEKAAARAAGFPYPGQTEWLGHLAGDVPTVMMLVADRLRVALVTTHLALREALEQLSVDAVVACGEVVGAALRERFRIPAPRLALCAVNPHAGEQGLFGDEEARILAPAAAALGAAGPFPADTVFVRALRGEFDAVLAPYHDVGMTAVKVAGFGHGVNVTLGLPFVRTSPDHGTAFDIAGTGTADPSSMREAVRLAVVLSRKD